MKPVTKCRAFTLIELLTVMAIITLLIGLLTPALSSARDRARTTAVQAQVNAMAVGLESFHGDHGMYPPSNAAMYANDLTGVTTATEMGYWEVVDASGANVCQGAHLLVDALVGRDILGYDPKAPKSASDPYNRWDSKNSRRQPYIPKDGIDVTSEAKPPEDAFGPVPSTSNPVGLPQFKDKDNLLVRVFRDKFGWPILYYRANPTSNQNTPIIQTTLAAPYDFHGDGVYDGRDNEVFTSYDTTNCASGSGNSAHRICDANLAFATDAAACPANYHVAALSNRFAEFIRSIRATSYDTATPDLICWPRPVRSDAFILLSAGKDGIYGTLDDVANFNVLSEDR